MADPSYADSEMVTKVIRLLQDLRQSISASRVTLQNNYQFEKEEGERLLASHTERVNNLSNVVIPSLQDEIESRIGEIGSKK